jgi:hypothetical protein
MSQNLKKRCKKYNLRWTLEPLYLFVRWQQTHLHSKAHNCLHTTGNQERDSFVEAHKLEEQALKISLQNSQYTMRYGSSNSSLLPHSMCDKKKKKIRYLSRLLTPRIGGISPCASHMGH